MASTFTIQLNKLRLFGTHGMYAEEIGVGNEFEINIAIEIKAPKTEKISIHDTVNYAEVYRIVKDVFSQRKLLLESLAAEIAGELKSQFVSIKKISIQISKLNPPIVSFSGSVSVTYKKSYK